MIFLAIDLRWTVHERQFSSQDLSSQRFTKWYLWPYHGHIWPTRQSQMRRPMGRASQPASAWRPGCFAIRSSHRRWFWGLCLSCALHGCMMYGLCMCISIYVFIYVCICICMCIYICVCVCLCVCYCIIILYNIMNVGRVSAEIFPVLPELLFLVPTCKILQSCCRTCHECSKVLTMIWASAALKHTLEMFPRSLFSSRW